MKREDLMKEMKQAVGTKEPIVFFDKMADAINLLFDRIDQLEVDLQQVKVQSALSIQWEPKLASEMLAKQVYSLRQNQDKDAYKSEIDALKEAYAQDKVTQNYQEFCKFWVDTLGWHPFLDSK
jgi:hypothetical protein